MKVWGSIVGGIVLLLVGVLWIMQGLNLLGQSGGMNGHKVFAVIGIVVAIIGVVLISVGVRARKTTPVG